MTETVGKPARNLRFPILGVVIGILVGVIVGISQVRPEGYAVLAGFVASVCVGVFYVAPKAGMIAKHRFFQSFTSPDPQDQAMIQAATVALVENMGGMAARALEDDDLGNQLKKAFYPVYDLATKRINQRWDMAVLNMKAQAARGAGPFNPANMGQDDFTVGLTERIMGIFEGPFEAFGVEGKFKEACRMKIANAIFGGQDNGVGRQPGGPSLPSAGGMNQGRGW